MLILNLWRLGMEKIDLIVIGAGISGLLAAIESKNRGIENIVVIEREDEPGGAINSCVHSGFHYKNIKENLTAPELISSVVKEALELGIIIKCNTTALELRDNNELVIVSGSEGINIIKSEAIILAMGSREKPFGYKNILGYGALSGLITSRATLNYIYKKGVLPGKECIILGSDEIGILTAKTLMLEGSNVKYIVETGSEIKAVEPESKEDIRDFNIPVLFRHRVVRVYGKTRVTGVDIVKLDDNYNIVDGSRQYIDCDTLVLCMKSKPDSEIAEKYGIKVNDDNDGIVVNKNYGTSHEGVFACGTVISGYSLMDRVMKEGIRAGRSASEYILMQREAENGSER